MMSQGITPSALSQVSSVWPEAGLSSSNSAQPEHIPILPGRCRDPHSLPAISKRRYVGVTIIYFCLCFFGHRPLAMLLPPQGIEKPMQIKCLGQPWVTLGSPGYRNKTKKKKSQKTHRKPINQTHSHTHTTLGTAPWRSKCCFRFYGASETSGATGQFSFPFYSPPSMS